MRALPANRATIAGFGSSAALLAAVIAVSLVVGGLFAFSASPSGPLVSRAPSLTLPSGAAGRREAAIVLPAPRARAAVARGRVPAVPGPRAGGVAVRPAGPRTSTQTPPAGTGRRVPDPPGPPRPGPKAGGNPSPLTPVKAATDAVADATAATGGTAAGTLGTAISRVARVVGAVSPPLGQAVTQVGGTLDTTVTGTVDAVATLVRRIGGG